MSDFTADVPLVALMFVLFFSIVFLFGKDLIE